MANKIVCDNRHIKGDDRNIIRKYKLKDSANMRHEILICESCSFADSKNPECNQCYGKIIVSIISNYSKRFKNIQITKKIYRDKFIINKNKVQDILEASEFLKKIRIEYEMFEYDVKNSKTSTPWYAYDRPDNYKTSCLKCKEKYEELKENTPCEKASEFYKNNKVDIQTYKQRDLSNIEFPKNRYSEFVCKEQSQRQVSVF